MKQRVLEDIGGTLTYTASEGSPAGTAYVTLYKANGDALVDRTACSISGASLSQLMTAAQAVDSDNNYRARWEYTVSATTYYRDVLFDIKPHILNHNLISTDLERQFPDVDEFRWSDLSNYSVMISEAWNWILDRIVAKGADPDYIMNPDQLRQAHIAATVWMISRAWGTEWREWSRDRYTEAVELLEEQWTALSWYDKDGDLSADTGEEDHSISSIKITR